MEDTPMKYLILVTILFLLASTTIAQDAESPPATQDDAPYLYYYSQALNSVVIERADGTDSRIIGQGLVDEDVVFVYRPGWSPDGQWFAWRVWRREGYYGYGSAGRGYVTSADGQTRLDLLDRFQCVDSMLWHPTDNILLVYGTIAAGNICPQRAYPVASFWLIDADTQTRLATRAIAY
jgi:hypothetical protein